MPNNALVVAKSNSFQSLKTYVEKHDASAGLARVFPEFFMQIDAVSTPTSGQLSIHLEGKDKLRQTKLRMDYPPKTARDRFDCC